MKTIIKILASVFFGILYINFASAQDESEQDLGEIAQQVSNPASGLTLLFVKNELLYFDDESISDSPQNSTLLQPVIVAPLFGGKYNLISRTTLQHLSVPFSANPEDPFDRTNGFGEMNLFALIDPAPKEGGGLISGFGPTFTFPTASDDVLGSGKFTMGPAGLLFYQAPDYGSFSISSFNIGLIAQTWWTIGGDSDRSSVTNSSFQYIINYRATPTWQIGMRPTVSVNWEAESGNKLEIPVGIGAGSLFLLGDTPIQWFIEGEYYVERQNDFGSDWAIIASLNIALPSLF